ncbi:MAG: presenilin [Thaumarchaeota archaeon]|nr:presenilin [Nitrososphaerota archaeon]
MSEKPPEHKRVTPLNLAVAIGIVAAIQLVALAITNQNLPVYQPIVAAGNYSYNPLGSTPQGSAGNAILLVALAFGLTLGLVWLLRRKMVGSFKVLVFGSVSLSSFILTLITADSFAFTYLPRSLELVVSFGSAVAVVLLVGYTIFVKDRLWLSTVLLAFIGAEVGSFFASSLPLYTALILPAAFSIYDIYAVFKGPLKALIGTAPNIALVGMSIKAGEFTLGLGDIVFYTMLPSLALFYRTPLASGLTIVAIDAGVVATLFLLSRKRLLPGLPIPMLLGLIVLGAFLL